MSWIKDVSHEIKALDISAKSLKKFGLTVGTVFLVAGLLLLWRGAWSSVRIYFIAIGFALLLSGLLQPEKLKNIYKVWMGFAFALGWIVSRIILMVLFYFVLMPIGFVAKVVGKDFLDIKFQDGKESYWIPKEKKKIDYEKMF